MLVLSRRPEEKILLPSVPAVIKVISAAAGVVRLGIEAPPNVPILREEARNKSPREPEPAPAEAPADLRQAVRGRVRELGLGLALLRLQLSDCSGAVRQTLDDMQREIEALCRSVACQPETDEPTLAAPATA